MFEQVNKVLKNIFSNEETIIFSLAILLFFLVISFFGSILTPFMISIVVAYLLVGMQKKIQSYDVSANVALIITFSVFIITGAALLIWLVPLLYIQLQAFILDVPNLINNFLDFISGLPAKFPDLVSSEQISIFFQAVSEEVSAIAQNIVKSSISGIQSAITFLLYIILFPILVYFFLFDRKNIIEGFIKIIPGKREMLTNIWAEMDIQLSNYVRGKTIEIFIVGIAAAIIFASLGLKYSALLSVLVGLSVIIPYVGAFLVTIPIVVVGLLQFGLGTEFYLLIGLYLLLQALDGNLLVPIIFSETVKLHPVVIILAVFIFGSMFGFWGVFFSIPIATFIKAVWNAWPSSPNNDLS
ncbi:MAG: AI-2E family transporter [Proteobacteria bacterium]|jgi:putative permease|nr:AI-2E family transporter [Pseudomonadota bacterium]NCW37511.1 AI-2E family transporter [Pseudomonadota bacterium]NCX74525.1 AI-2E family transporter [Pseudomonadota bacterium]|tara:strand:+ start:95 stop:1159 length:1065 start_codon:yes stop_codon:yes gene_type:complete